MSSAKRHLEIARKDALPFMTRPMRPALSNKPTNIRKDNGSLRKRIVHGMVSKHGLPKKPQQTHVHPSKSEIVLVEDFLPICREHYARAVSWFNQIRTLPLIGCVPQLRSPNPINDSEWPYQGIVLKYPARRFWPLSRHMPSSNGLSVPPLTRHDLRTLRQILTHDIRVLYDAHIPYKPGILIPRLLINRVGSRTPQGAAFKPWINDFDYDIDIDQKEDFPWADVKESVIKSVKAQFAVLEAAVEVSIHPRRELRANLEPNAVIKVLEPLGVGIVHHNLIIRGVSVYSVELGHYFINKIVEQLCGLPSRKSLQGGEHIFTVEWCKAVPHVLRLVESAAAAESIEQGHLLMIRALLLAAHAILLVRSHAKVITSLNSENLVVLEEEETVDMYWGVEQFQLVTNARRKLADAIDALDAVNARAGDRVREFVKRPGANEIKITELQAPLGENLP
ncbi:hypothetical protein GGR51DRAFT_540753 [Nemania sp. FL0031]|nr:hypothetical protein GGR51DRAFT_540753 [Nemania sp. FL0031]